LTLFAIGPFVLHMYGFCIAMGIILFVYCIKKNPKFYSIGLENHFDAMLSLSILSGIIGGRVLYCLTHPDEMKNFVAIISLWNGGLSILGAMIGIITTLFCYLRYYQLPILHVLDLISLYAPLMHASGRIGCFLAGCCHGALWNGPWAIMYCDPQSLAILHCAMHPSQLYSAGAFALMFILFYWYGQYYFQKAGQLFSWYLILSGIERFLNEFFRYEYQTDSALLSANQYIGLMFIACGICLFFWTKKSSSAFFRLD
jgi:phosphatidylglycerol:prolipoprotein diacylglycerol transferase